MIVVNWPRNQGDREKDQRNDRDPEVCVMRSARSSAATDSWADRRSICRRIKMIVRCRRIAISRPAKLPPAADGVAGEERRGETRRCRASPPRWSVPDASRSIAADDPDRRTPARPREGDVDRRRERTPGGGRAVTSSGRSFFRRASAHLAIGPVDAARRSAARADRRPGPRRGRSPAMLRASGDRAWYSSAARWRLP